MGFLMIEKSLLLIFILFLLMIPISIYFGYLISSFPTELLSYGNIS